eukprot:Hpha_TRINITY_DN476_c0_g1::TRINITY_DN476_c0_g1_i1::g.27768::m.27768
MRPLLLLLAVGSVAAGVPPPVDDFHYPAEEVGERSGLSMPNVLSIDLSTQPGFATLQLAGAQQRVAVGSVWQGWALQSVFNAPEGVTAALEYDFDRWGLIMFTGVKGAWQRIIRKGVGFVDKIRRPLYNISGADAQYFTKALANGDYLRQLMEADGKEPTFAESAGLLTPTHDYALVAVSSMLTKFSVSMSGVVKTGNTSIYTPELGKSDVDINGNTVFDPRRYTAYWPASVPPAEQGVRLPFTDYKTARLGHHLSAYTIAAYDRTAGKGFHMSVVPDYSIVGGVFIRLGDFAQGDAQAVSALQYFRVGITNTSVVTQQAGEFYAALLHHAQDIDDNIVRTKHGALDIALEYGTEGQRLVDMSRAALVDLSGVWEGLEPNYGDGNNYWGGGGRNDKGALLLESFSLDNALVQWGEPFAAAQRVEYYLNNYVRNASGLTPPPYGSQGAPGSIDWKHWKDYCPDRFADGLTDYGRFIDMYINTCRGLRNANTEYAAAWEKRTFEQLSLLANYSLGLRLAAVDKKLPAPNTGLIWGPAEHDTCTDPEYYFSNNFWFWRGFLLLGRYYTVESARSKTSPEYALGAKLMAAVPAYKRDIQVALDQSLLKLNGTFFVPPYASLNFTPFHSMVESTVASYSNFRYYSEMLFSGFLNDTVAQDLCNFRETFRGTLGGINRYTDHLDDMPSLGYAMSSLRLGRLASFWSLLFGHAANYQSRGTFASTEQLDLYGDGSSTASMRHYLSASPTTKQPNEVDIDFCVPSASLVAFMVRAALVTEGVDEDALMFNSGAPRRWYGAELRASNAPTRFGNVTVVTTSNATAGTAHIMLSLSGEGYIEVKSTLQLVVRFQHPTNTSVTFSWAHVTGAGVQLISFDPRVGVAKLALQSRDVKSADYTLVAEYAV